MQANETSVLTRPSEKQWQARGKQAVRAGSVSILAC